MKMKISTANFAKNQNHDGSTSRIAVGAFHPPKKSVTARPLMAKSPRYSPRKKSANLNPEYSVRYPAMISDSASGKSNGERFDSAVAAIRNNINAANPHGVKTNHCGNQPRA